MAKKLDPRETIGLEELLMSNVIEQEALVNLLVAKWIVSGGELSVAEGWRGGVGDGEVRKRRLFGWIHWGILLRAKDS